MKDDRLVELAIRGLEAERDRIEEELAALRSRGRAGRPAGRPAGSGTGRKPGRPPADPDAPKTRKKRNMSPAAKKALSARMKRIWAERRKNG